jgi:FKBP-type peptidyl-prolyl cis-trans isomerase
MSKNKIITISIIIIFILAFYFLTKGSNNSETQLSESTNKIMPTLSLSQVTELKIEDIKVGTGREVKSGDTVEMNYVGTLEDGTKFDSSYDRKQTFSTQIGVGQVIQGWDQGVPGMKVGGKRKLTIPYQLAYGEAGIPGAIPAKATLIFEVELVSIK